MCLSMLAELSDRAREAKDRAPVTLATGTSEIHTDLLQEQVFLPDS